MAAHSTKRSRRYKNNEHVPLEKVKEKVKSYLGRQKITDSIILKRTLASYELAFLICKEKAAYTDGENLIKKSLDIVSKRFNIDIPQIALSPGTIKSHAIDISLSLKKDLLSVLKKKLFSIAVDEATDSSNEKVLCCFVRYISNGQFVEQLLFTQSIPDGRSETIKQAVKACLAPEILVNCVGITTDGAKSMIGCQNGFQVMLTEEIRLYGRSYIANNHCYLHRLQLSIRDAPEKLKEGLDTITDFALFLHNSPIRSGNFKDYIGKVFPTFVSTRWLSRYECVSFCLENIFEIVEYLIQQKPAEYQKYISFFISVDGKVLVRYWYDILYPLWQLNKKLQGKYHNFIDVCDLIEGYKNIIKEQIESIEQGNIQFLKETSQYIIDIDSEPSWLKEECKSHLKLISSTLEQRIVPVSDDFKDLVVNPLGFNKYEILKEDIKVDLIFLQSNSHVRKAFQGKDYVDFWLSIEEIVSTQYGKLWDIIAPLIITFPTTYSVECAFSSMAFIKDCYRNKLNIEPPHRLALCDSMPDFRLVIERKRSGALIQQEPEQEEHQEQGQEQEQRENDNFSFFI